MGSIRTEVRVRVMPSRKTSPSGHLLLRIVASVIFTSNFPCNPSLMALKFVLLGLPLMSPKSTATLTRWQRPSYVELIRRRWSQYTRPIHRRREKMMLSTSWMYSFLTTMRSRSSASGVAKVCDVFHLRRSLRTSSDVLQTCISHVPDTTI
jgi:hypothetical protein